MDELNAFKVFNKEINELIKLYKASKYAYINTKNALDIISTHESGRRLSDVGLNIEFSLDFENSDLFLQNLERDLCELIFVRAISALEVFFVDTLRDIFVISKQPFKNQLQLSLTYGEILSTDSMTKLFNKIINKECRALSNGGFNEIVKYYKKNLKVDLSNLQPSKERMQEYHDVRHLFVHRLGKVDSNFRKKYKLSNKKSGISVTPELLFIFFSDIQSFVSKTHELVILRLSDFTSVEAMVREPDLKIEYSITVKTSKDLIFLNPSFEFWVDDDLLTLQNFS